jgi:hypothetical protein
MRASALYSRKRNRKGEGPRKFVKIQVPEEVFNDLKLYKDLYSIHLSTETDEKGNPIPKKVSFEQMFVRWMTNVKRFDKDIAEAFVSSKESMASVPDLKEMARQMVGQSQTR